MKQIFLLLFTCLAAFGMEAQVVINEFSAANYSDVTVEVPGDFGPQNDFEDWIEIYNPSGMPFDLAGYHLSDKLDNPTKFEIPAGAVVPANGVLTFYCSKVGEEFNGNFHTNFGISQTDGESIILADAGGTIIDSYTITQANQTNHSIGRLTDGAAEWVYFTNPTPAGSNNGSASGASYSPDVAFSAAAGYQGASLNLTMTSAEAGVEIRYTLDGSEPGPGSILYTGPVTLDTTTPVRAIAYSANPNVLPSFIETNTFFFGDDQHTLPIWAISGATLGDGTWNGDELTVIEMFDENGNRIAIGHGDSNEHGNDSNAYAQRGFDYVNRDQMGYEKELEYPVFSNKDRDSFKRLIFKAGANDNYPFSGGGGGAHIRDAYIQEMSQRGELRVDERSMESCILYINGEYWGVYDVREKVDDIDFTDHYYDQPDGFVDYLKTWGGTWEEYGSIDEWNDLVDFVTGSDMSDPANYDYVKSVFNTGSLIDYFILNTYTVNADWLNWNTSWWRGLHPDGDKKKWRYSLWDMDNTFGYGANYTGIGTQDPDADPCQVEDMGDVGGQGHVPILNALFDNEEFTADYINRYADLSNTVFSCESMIGLLDEMIGTIAPEMERQTQRWGGNVPEWESNVQDVRDYIQERCADEIIGGLEDCYDVEAFTLTLIIEGIGEVQISTVDINELNSPWSGTYFGDLPIDLSALTDLGVFLNWEVTAGDLVIGDPTNPEITIVITGDVTITAVFLNDLDPVDIMVNVQPAGAGDVTIDGNIMGPYPNTHTLDAGVMQQLGVIPATEWFEFDHWETLNHNIDPDEFDPNGEVMWFTTDTLIAVFNELPHHDLIVDVQPAGAGSITRDGVLYDTYPWSGEIAGNIDFNFVAIPSSEWFNFLYWEIDNHIILPSEFTADMVLNLSADDVLTAVFEEIPNHEVTIQVKPIGAGYVDYQGFQIRDSYTTTLEGNIPHNFTVVQEDYIDFTGWSGNNHVPSPDAMSTDVSYVFNQNDTIIAHFDEQDFAFFIPTAFSPNNDDLNEVFKPEGFAFDIDNYKMSVYNRWGEMLFQTTDYTKGWNGSVNGSNYYAEVGIYTYIIEVFSVHDNAKKTYSGNVVLYR